MIDKRSSFKKNSAPPKIITEILDNRYTDVVSLLHEDKLRLGIIKLICSALGLHYLSTTRFEKTLFYRPENDVFFLAKRCVNF